MDLNDRQAPALSQVDAGPHPSLKLAGRYRLTALMSRGSLADLYKAEDEVLGRPVVAKLLRRNLASDPGIKRLFRVEALSAARLTHANIVSVFDTGEHRDVPFLVMEYLGGGSLREILDNGPINPLRAAEWGAEICAALAHAHQQGIVHRDIRPENVLFTETGHLKVSDFAIARAALGSADPEVSTTGSHSAYSCPEPDPDGRGDLYSLGVVLFECLTGETPSRATARAGEPPSEILRPGTLRAGIPMELDAAVLKLLARDPAKRFQSAQTVRSTLLGVIDDSAPAPQPKAPAARPAAAASRPKGRAPQPTRSQQARRAPAARKETFLRTEGRWLLPTLAVIAGAVAIALSVPSVRSGIDRALNNVPGAGSEPARVTRGFDYDPPPGDGSENSARVGNAFDGDQSTYWSTTGYRNPNLGGLKPGVGIAFDLGEAQELSGVKVGSVTGGWQGSIRFSDDGDTWSSPGESIGAGTDQTFDVSGSHRYWMVWITGLVRTQGEGNDNNPYAVAIREIQPLT